MAGKLPVHKRKFLNQSINFFWTILSFIPVLVFWSMDGFNGYFFWSLAASFIFGLLPEKILNLFLLSPNRKFYERLGVKLIRKFVQNGDVVKSVASEQKQTLINNIFKARQYLKTIAMYERYHWICFSFFLLTSVRCFIKGNFKLGFLIIGANLLYNVCSIILQQYNKIRIRRIVAITKRRAG